MRRIALMSVGVLAAFALAGCQSADEKRAERDKLKSEIREEVIAEMRSLVAAEVRIQLHQAIEDHRRKLAQQAAAAAARPAAPAAPAAPRRR